MSGTRVFHTEILNEKQQQVLPQLATALAETEYYLAGGTGLALQIGHRSSVDFDWFINKLGEPEHLFRRLKSFNIHFQVLSVSVETVYLTIDTVQVSFIGYDYPLLQSILYVPEHHVKLAAIDDIACMKLSAIASRGSRKDFIDLHYLFIHFHSLEDYLTLYQQKYQQRDIAHIIRSLVYFADAEAEPEINVFHPVDWPQLKADFEMWVRGV